MLRPADLDAASAEIARLFAAQCEFGAQAVELAPQGGAACGQYLNNNSSRQRGLHGTAAALSVLARLGTDKGKDLSGRTLAYLAAREAMESQMGMDAGAAAKLARDRQNVIKLSEVLYALSLVSPAVGEREALVKGCADELLASVRNGQGWSYFRDDKLEAELLPTAYAVRALASCGYPVNDQIAYLIRLMDEPGKSQPDVFVQVAGLFVLAFLEAWPSGTNRDLLGKWLDRLWQQLESLLSQDLEANIEYSYEDENYYVRVPWQLYLVAVAARERPYRIFATARIQNRFETVVRAASTTDGFAYPHSGVRLSARTNAILFDVLSLVRRHVDQTPGLRQVSTMADRVRLALGSRWVAALGIVLAVGLAGYTTVAWFTRKGAAPADLGPNFAVAFAMLLLALRKRV